MDDVFWAAFGGGAAAGMVTLVAVMFAEWLRRRSDQPLLNIKASVGLEVGPYRNNDVKIYVTASNPRSKPVTVEGMGISLKGGEGKNMVIFSGPNVQFPHEIESGKNVTVDLENPGIISALQGEGKGPGNLDKIWFRAADGREYKCKVPNGVRQQIEMNMPR